ncbi:neural proliferation differentiation and control protein 1 [Rhinatrema bivittatum]|uniref:neural proliferation differentiation and control protein 1 n=1 Tax=Rhinatrema bivittatum TaxID=194408 RepID=UPI00112A89A4|nr:neural proliferation differentiation and control protein 1 [Rhinatrema bivittatum]
MRNRPVVGEDGRQEWAGHNARGHVQAAGLKINYDKSESFPLDPTLQARYDSCPSKLDCTIKKREYCPPGSDTCGPCLKELVEDVHGECIPKTRTRTGQADQVLVRDVDPVSPSKARQQAHSGSEIKPVLKNMELVVNYAYEEWLWQTCHYKADELEMMIKFKHWKPRLLLDENIDFLASVLAQQGSRDLQLENQGTTTVENQPPANVPHGGSSGKNRAANPSATDQPIASTENGTKGSSANSSGPVYDTFLLGLVIACSLAGLIALIVAAVCWYRLQKEIKLAQKTDYMAQKAPAPPPYDKSSPGDKKLAQSAQMYHYQHQKQQMLSLEKQKDEPKLPDSATTSDEENEDGDFTVYECPGLAPTGEMEVKNPLFDDSSMHPSRESQ